MNLGDIAFQVFSLIFLLMLIFTIYFAIKSLFTYKSHSSNSKSIEEKLDTIIELLEKDKKNESEK
ncbi:DUF4083 family protein [Bacillus massiliigorillae]|uniref:DUF4083 family protein n=1 Tax=Bacillus massiliigorillae TaxID=1243664 RepID=UPI0003AB246F|nr:DUF4083 family protein [Bacillus massiliigorillae]